MTLTRASFKGRSEEQRQAGPWPYNSGEDFADPGPSAEALIKTMTGAAAMQSGVSKGMPDGMSGPGDDQVPPRQLYPQPGLSGTVQGGNSASTGKAGAVPASVDATGGPAQTGAGQGSKIVKSYGSKTVGGPQGLTTPGGNLGSNTG